MVINEVVGTHEQRNMILNRISYANIYIGMQG